MKKNSDSHWNDLKISNIQNEIPGKIIKSWLSFDLLTVIDSILSFNKLWAWRNLMNCKEIWTPSVMNCDKLTRNRNQMKLRFESGDALNSCLTSPSALLFSNSFCFSNSSAMRASIANSDSRVKGRNKLRSSSSNELESSDIVYNSQRWEPQLF